MNTFQEIFDKQKANFDSDATKTYEWRVDQLDRMAKMLMENEADFQSAMGRDFKTAFAEQFFETRAPLATMAGVKAQLKDWMRPTTVPVPKFLAATGHTAEVIREPYGITLVISPSNGPLLLSLRPAIGALSAGNTVILKTSNALPGTSEVLTRLIPKYFEPESVAVVSGNRDAITELLQLPFDFIFFTGSVPVGKVIARAAAEHITPVILELGGQNPALVDETADIKDAAEKIIWGATAWGGQWCTSPGFAIVHESVAEQFVKESISAINNIYGDDPKKSPDYSRIISVKELQRLVGLLDPAKVVAGGEFDESERYLAPTIVYPVYWEDKMMEDEIFGPILPILTYSDFGDAIKKLKSIPKPLAGFIFSNDSSRVQQFLNSLSFGGGAVNQVNVHLYVESMPFGGVGSSGLGHYYGKYGFETMTHAKSILYEPAGGKIDHLIPPYTQEKIEALMQWGNY
jgi:aldehyde dehydrogenase (NAD+)